MLETLRKKFIAVNMALVFVVLAAVLAGMCVSSYSRARSETERALAMALSRRDGFASPPFAAGQRPSEEISRTPVFVLEITRSGAIRLLFADGVTAAAEDLSVMAAQAAGPDGVLAGYNLRYLAWEERGVRRLAFADMSEEGAALRGAVLLSLLALGAALAAFFAVSLFLARWALRPAQQAWQQQRRFVADASHELKTPLTVILANMDILKGNPAATVAEAHQWIDNTQTEAVRMRRLVDDMLFLAKADETRAVPLAPLNFSDVALGGALTFEAVAYARGVSIDAEGVTPDICVLGDEQRLRQLVAILLDNGVKYAAEGGRVTVALTAQRDRALLTVHNDGAPVPEEDLTRLFDRFYRADPARSAEGFGLGLSIAQSIVRLHHGKITARSDGGGTVFAVDLRVLG
ncbi:MAG: two-component sensor histidine kinase [Oscillospiraceae bacterium]|jgi:signal transduction histidine kinase|nr:two-component sensor histidine kinase [Oscillospiraceae bacterium]